tara:strand:- start:604 stop:1269 length:666 start_codon:yes stop_codon:yes gene_type:complete
MFMSKYSPILWYDNIPIDEELLSDTVDNILSGDKEFRCGDEYYTSYFRNSIDKSGPDTIFSEYYNNIINRASTDLGLFHRSEYQIATWMQVYITGNSMRIHDHYYGGELYSFVHFVQPTDDNLFFFIDSNNNKIYPDEQRKDDFIIFPAWLEHGVEDNTGDDKRAIISGNVMLKFMYRDGFRDYSKVDYISRPDGGETVLIDNNKNTGYKPKHRHSELDSL